MAEEELSMVQERRARRLMIIALQMLDRLEAEQTSAGATDLSSASPGQPAVS